ncbi:hypothetical protein A9K65_013945 [Mesorhizobium sp. WSM1497]|uniref:DUF6894 family protein n=1 Tax=Mesorhizobium sp. WSM1497 TaxID=278153 RepID=UPI0007ED1C61|nr:hypothetical protein [Mesorhizobium sp. WSM1497]ARP67748.1 hypothetical protein A9K65_013945 [Mesorhizobium sp. WSM1497]
MPRYFFDFWEDGNLIADKEGTDLPDFEAARDEGFLDLMELANDILPRNGAHELKLVVRDEAGRDVIALSLNYREEGL